MLKLYLFLYPCCLKTILMPKYIRYSLRMCADMGGSNCSIMVVWSVVYDINWRQFSAWNRWKSIIFISFYLRRRAAGVFPGWSSDSRRIVWGCLLAFLVCIGWDRCGWWKRVWRWVKPIFFFNLIYEEKSWIHQFLRKERR